MVEQSQSSVNQRHAVFHASIGDHFIVGRPARTDHVLDARFGRSINVVAEGEESIGTEWDIRQSGQPFFAFILLQHKNETIQVYQRWYELSGLTSVNW